MCIVKWLELVDTHRQVSDNIDISCLLLCDIDCDMSVCGLLCSCVFRNLEYLLKTRIRTVSNLFFSDVPSQFYCKIECINVLNMTIMGEEYLES